MLNKLSDLDILALRYRTAFDKTKAGREQWIEGTLELAATLLDLRNTYPDHREYARWTAKHQLECLLPNVRWALTKIGEMDPVEARKLLVDNCRFSWRTIWEKKAKKPVTDPSAKGKGPQQTFSRTSGSSKRKRAVRIPTVMQDDYEPPERAKAFNLKARELTPEQVDPDFKGTPLEFTTKYGHVPLHTKGELEHHKCQEALATWLRAMTDYDLKSRAMLTALAAVDPATLREWLAKPGKTEKLRTWCQSIKLVLVRLREIDITL
jgi:hypothetical protein